MKLFAWFTGLETQMKVIALLAAIGLVIIGLGTAYHLVDTAFEAAEGKGAVTERVVAQGKVIEHVEKANAAAERYRSDPVQRDADCLRDARNPEDC